MPKFEELGNELDQYAPEQPVHDEELVGVLQDVLFNFYDEAVKAGFEDEIHNLEVDGRLELIARDIGNEVAVQMQDDDGEPTSDIVIGYFNPATGLHELYPEFVKTEKERITLQAAALLLRDQAIYKFDQGETTAKERFDFDNEAVQQLHSDHNDFLDEYILERILTAYNSGQALPQDHIEMDSSTHGAICILPDRGVGVKVSGGYALVNGFKFRRTEQYIKIADQFYDPEGSDGGLVVIGDFGELIEFDELRKRVEEVTDLSCDMIIDGKKFDTKKLGIKARPRA